ncbi:hypothetical protein VTK73DRAFT_2645 [Phialemonium thermophilum]|uniref:Secreted protein n=1 Tax=Phialemonium thermophilum TaxID=223376 RepID=A0ABR3X3C1_9PEZI
MNGPGLCSTFVFRSSLSLLCLLVLLCLAPLANCRHYDGRKLLGCISRHCDTSWETLMKGEPRGAFSLSLFTARKGPHKINPRERGHRPCRWKRKLSANARQREKKKKRNRAVEPYRGCKIWISVHTRDMTGYRFIRKLQLYLPNRHLTASLICLSSKMEKEQVTKGD